MVSPRSGFYATNAVMPHIIVVLGSPVWETTWRALRPEAGFASEHFMVESYQTCGNPCFHHANLVTGNVFRVIALSSHGKRSSACFQRPTRPACTR
jgi:hypothetical protein